MQTVYLNTTEIKEKARSLSAGDTVYLSGTVYTSRDAAHKRIMAQIKAGEALPYPIDGAVYFCAIGGAGALASKCITECTVIAYDDLGCESVKRLTFKNFPLTVAIDCHGGNLFQK